MQNKINDNLLLDLKKDIFFRAKLFIDDMGEFAPFGSELINDTIKPVVIYDDTEDVIKGLKLVDLLKNSFSLKLKNKEIQAGAIAYDVFINNRDSNNVMQKRNALCLEISIDGEHWEEDYYLYKVIDQECVWG